MVGLPCLGCGFMNEEGGGDEGAGVEVDHQYFSSRSLRMSFALDTRESDCRTRRASRAAKSIGSLCCLTAESLAMACPRRVMMISRPSSTSVRIPLKRAFARHSQFE